MEKANVCRDRELRVVQNSQITSVAADVFALSPEESAHPDLR